MAQHTAVKIPGARPAWLPTEVHLMGKHGQPEAGSLVERLCMSAMAGESLELGDSHRRVELAYQDGTVLVASLGEVCDRLREFPRVAATADLPDLSDVLTRRLYATYLTCMAAAAVKYPLDVKSDARGSLANIMRSPAFGQVAISRTVPGVTRANHVHSRKVEKFLVVEGEGLVKLRRVGESDVTEIRVSGSCLEVVDIPPGMAHSIQNVGTGDMVLLFWNSEPLDTADLDTYPADVTLTR